ncbi:Sulfotransferase 1A4 [Armadillidium vulgare]|nr:Sulfotransferase 1A4 [Armadillidium vulgare]
MIHLASLHPDPRLLKDHLPLHFFTRRYLCIARDPRDIAVSGYHYHKPVPFGPWWEHMRLHWEIRNHPNFLLLFYEDLKENPETEIKKIDKFLGTKRTDEQIRNVKVVLRKPPSSSSGENELLDGGEPH